MQTIKTISNISYNTDAFFQGVISNLEDRGIIDWCYWIRHKADADELKSHIHFVLKPSKRLDTKTLGAMFQEIDPNNVIPLGCTKKWNYTNSLDDWLLYAVHDIGYLASKGQIRNFHYDFDAIQSTDTDALRADWNAIDRTKYNRLALLADAVDKRIPFAILVQQSVIPISQRQQYEYQYNALMFLSLNGVTGRKIDHENAYIDENGEIIDGSSETPLIEGFELFTQEDTEDIPF